MPTLDWIGKDKVINHHHDVPYRVLDRQYSYDSNGQTIEDNNSKNMIIQGDNLEALKSLLPQYENSIDCIYIDPPYNTNKDGWKYDDKVDNPIIKKWLGKVVGNENKDLTRHDKWLCMMYPRLKLLYKLLAYDGTIFISIDDNEQAYLKILCDEIFSRSNFEGHIHWRRRNNQPNDKNKLIGLVAEHILVYSKNKEEHKNLGIGKVAVTGKFSNPDNDVRGEWATKPWKSGENQSGCRYDIVTPKGIVFNEEWLGDESTFNNLLNDNRIVFTNNGDGLPRKKYFKFERIEEGQCATNWWDFSSFGCNQDASKEIKNLFGDTKVFKNPKPSTLIKSIIGLGTIKKDAIILDSFAGSGTTAHAVLNLNKEDGGNRKFILIEMLDYAEDITAERVKRVIKGYGEGNKAVEGTGGDFSFYKLGEQLLIDDELNENLPLDTIRKYIWFTETRTDYIQPNNQNPYFLGDLLGTDYYFYYEKEKLTVLNKDFLATINRVNNNYLIYADICNLSDEQLLKYNITFKKIPRDITKF